jgi:hypothetical protein
MTTGRFYASAAAMAAALGGIFFPVTALLAAASRVQVEVTGTITPYCANSITAAPVNAGDPRKAGSASFAFTVDCNAPFQYTMQSDNGALRLTNAPDAVSRDQIEVAYNVHIRIPLTLGGSIDDTCSSKSIKHGATSCPFTDSGQKVAINQQAETQISWNSSQARLLAGQYTDRLTVFVSVKL